MDVIKFSQETDVTIGTTGYHWNEVSLLLPTSYAQTLKGKFINAVSVNLKTLGVDPTSASSLTNCFAYLRAVVGASNEDLPLGDVVQNPFFIIPHSYSVNANLTSLRIIFDGFFNPVLADDQYISFDLYIYYSDFSRNNYPGFLLD